MPTIEDRVRTLEVRVDTLETWAGPGHAQALSDGQLAIRSDLAALRRTQSRHGRQLSALAADMAEVRETLSRHDNQLSALSADVAALKQDVSALSRTFRGPRRAVRPPSRTCPWSRAPSVRCCDGCRLAPLADGGVLPSALTARASRACADLLLQVEQEALAIEPAAVSGQASVGADKPVAGHDDADRITRVRVAHGPAGAG